jgi:hypothetical protein
MQRLQKLKLLKKQGLLRLKQLKKQELLKKKLMQLNSPQVLLMLKPLHYSWSKMKLKSPQRMQKIKMLPLKL